MKRYTLSFILIFLSVILFFILNLVLGTISIPFSSVWNILWGLGEETEIWQNIIWKSRFPQTMTALVAGAGLSISGLQMQTVFRNPLAGPSELGISSGASLGVAFIILLSGSIGGVALNKPGGIRRSSRFDSGYCRGHGRNVDYHSDFATGKRKCNSAHHRCYDRVYCNSCYRRTQIFQ